jgi:hypothetical protein
LALLVLFLAGLKFGAFDALSMASSPSSQGQKVVRRFVTCEVEHFVHSVNVKGTCWEKKRVETLQSFIKKHTLD